jgi:glycosyltransferase involved in cell wall biosynthesis
MATKKTVDIIHVYAATAGISGTYLHEIQLSLESEFSQKLFVNYRYPFKNARKIFYKYSELSSDVVLPNKIRLVIRYFELCYALIVVFKSIVVNNVKILSYNLTSDLRVELFFLKMVKLFSKTRIVVVCHDVVPFTFGSQKIDKKLSRKKHFFELANFLIVHNENSIDDLKTHYLISKDILRIPFPVMDISYLKDCCEDKLHNQKAEIVFGMFGYFRREKGVVHLIDAWKKFVELKMPNARLLLYGFFPEKFAFLNENLDDYNVIVSDNYLSDCEYFQFIRNCDVIVLPYSRGTNSGILSTVACLNKRVILSDIALFRENNFFLTSDFFEVDNSTALAKVLCSVYSELLNYDKEDIIMDNNISKFRAESAREYRFAFQSMMSTF